MAHGIRWYGEIAGLFLLWVEEVPDNPPWVGHVLRRPRKFVIPKEPSYERFAARTDTAAKNDAALTVRNKFPDYAHRVGELEWKQFNLTNEEWDAIYNDFVCKTDG